MDKTARDKIHFPLFDPRFLLVREKTALDDQCRPYF